MNIVKYKYHSYNKNKMTYQSTTRTFLFLPVTGLTTLLINDQMDILDKYNINKTYTLEYSQYYIKQCTNPIHKSRPFLMKVQNNTTILLNQKYV